MAIPKIDALYYHRMFDIGLKRYLKSNSLLERELHIIQSRKSKETRANIAREFGVSEGTIFNTEKKALQKISKEIKLIEQEVKASK